MHLATDTSWRRRGFSLLWGTRLLTQISKPGEVVSVRQFFSLARAWPEDLASGSGSTLVVAGLEGCIDALKPEDAEVWIASDLKKRVLSFQDEYEGQAGLVLWLASGKDRLRMKRATDAYEWVCGHPYAHQMLPIGRLLWSGAEADVARILDTEEKNQDPDGPAWAGLHHPRIS